jgi:ATP-binding cassette subfamily A (ABC1) protein 3
LYAGSLVCSGTPHFLKSTYGVGYNLTITLASGAPDYLTSLTQLVSTHFPSVAPPGVSASEVRFRLPLGRTTELSALLAALDTNPVQLGVTDYGISVTTLEDVFLQVAGQGKVSNMPGSTGLKKSSSGRAPHSQVHSVLANTFSVENPLGMPPVKLGKPSSGGDTNSSRRRGCCRQTYALIMKRLSFARRDARAAFCQCLLPVVIVLAGFTMLRLAQPADPPSMVLYPDWDGTTPTNKMPALAFKSGNQSAPCADLQTIVSALDVGNAAVYDPASVVINTRLDLQDVDDPHQFIAQGEYNYPKKDVQRLSALLLNSDTVTGAPHDIYYAAVMFTQDETLAWHQPSENAFPSTKVLTYGLLVNESARHALPIATNIVHSALYRLALANGSVAAATSAGGSIGSISTVNHPLPLTQRQRMLSSSALLFGATAIISVGFAFFPAGVAGYVLMERGGAKYQQLLSGVSVLAYWSSMLFSDVATFIVPASLCIAAAAAFGISEFVSATQDRVAAFVALLACYGLSNIPFTYALCFIFRSPSQAQTWILFGNIICVVLFIISFAIQQAVDCSIAKGLQTGLAFIPPFALGDGILRGLVFLDMFPVLEASCTGVSPASIGRVSTLEVRVAGWNLIAMAITASVCTCGVLITDYLFAFPALRPQCGRWRAKISGQGETDTSVDEDVDAERHRVAAQMTHHGTPAGVGGQHRMEDALLIDDLQKVYGDGKRAVNRLSFGVRRGEIFGLLGVNGAGKTTTFKMLIGGDAPSSGRALIDGHDTATSHHAIRKVMGYCPQFDALLDKLTVVEHLYLYGRVRGIPEAALPGCIQLLLQQLDLKEFAHKLAGTLSGGNKRKLSVAMSIIGEPPVVLLDEPSTGMDPAARRCMWEAILALTHLPTPCSILLTTHSMEEVEALCERIAIMVDGRLRCLGTAHHLKTRFGQGYLLEMHMQPPSQASVDSVCAVISSKPGAVIQNAQGIAVLTKELLAKACSALAAPEWMDLIVENGEGWVVAAAFSTKVKAIGAKSAASEEPVVPVATFAHWAAEQRMYGALVQHITQLAFPGAQVLERQGKVVKISVPASVTTSLSGMFTTVEALTHQLGIQSYSIGQASIEQIFNNFAKAGLTHSPV